MKTSAPTRRKEHQQRTPEPSISPDHLLKALRTFVAVAAEPTLQDEKERADAAQGASTDDSETLGWEEAGCMLWDVAALPDDAAFLLSHGLPAMLPPLLTAVAAREQWRALEIGLGVAANLACHADARRQLLQLEGLAALLLDQLLWVDDAGSLGEACRCTAGLVAAADGEAADSWWMLLLREETLGRLVWIVENTLSSVLLEKSLNLLSCLVSAAGAARASGDTSKSQLVPLLTALGLIPLLASILHGWVVKLHADEQQFASGSAAAGAAAAEQQGAGQQDVQPAAAGADPSSPGLAGADEATAEELEGDAAAGGAVAAEISEGSVHEALALLEGLAADEAGEAALNASAQIKDALLRLLANTDQRSTQALAASLLAELEGVGPQLLAQPTALAAVLRRLSSAAQQRPEKRLKAGGGQAAGVASAEEQAEEAEAGWALCSALARVLGGVQGSVEEGPEQGGAPAQEAVLDLLAGHASVLRHDWSSSPRAASIQKHQAYVLRRLALLLGPRLQGDKREALQAAAAKCEAAVQSS